MEDSSVTESRCETLADEKVEGSDSSTKHNNVDKDEMKDNLEPVEMDETKVLSTPEINNDGRSNEDMSCDQTFDATLFVEAKDTTVICTKEGIDESEKEENKDVEQNQPNETEKFVSKLGLENFYPEKIKPMDVMEIKATSHSPSLPEIPWIVLKNLMMINSTSRDKMVEEYLETIPDDNEPENEIATDIQEFDPWSDIGISRKHISMNPMDLMVVIFKCCSPILKNIIAAKLFMCKLAIPFVLPHEKKLLLHNSILHSIVMDDKTTGKGVSQKLAVNCPCKVVSFIRYGQPSYSKSNTINGILYPTLHNTFFNENCSLGRSEKLISNGIIEIAWLIPDTISPFFENITAFCNLRGDCQNYRDQQQLLSVLSNVIVFFVELNSLQNQDFIKTLKGLCDAVTGGIVLAIDAFNNDDKTIHEIRKYFNENFKGDKTHIKICPVAQCRKMETANEVQKKLCAQISQLMKYSTTDSLSSRLKNELPDSVLKDEDTEQHKNAREKILLLEDLIPDKTANVRDLIAPLQGKLWHEWSKQLKMSNKSSHSSLHEREKYVEEMKKARQQQLAICRKMSSFMKSCLQFLLDTIEQKSDFMLFVDWLKSTLDDYSRSSSYKYLIQYQADLQKLKKAKQDEAEQDKLDNFEKEVQSSKENWIESSFRFEHIMRELGQIYEALFECKDNITNGEKELLAKLPVIGANLLLTGQPFEIMDGDAANVPLLWVKAVLAKLKEQVGDKRILSLSVVGVQSSGKSTLLNTMFGVQFSVSAGRCTRGVFMQLIPVHENHFQFEYAVIIDTEGLRAPDQLASQKYTHDNKLATFVIGLGDIVIVNVKGENTSEVKDIIQIAVHAFLRLKLANKRLNLKQSCMFIHQNVPAVDAEDKMIEERQVFVESLNEMTKEAAEQENIADIQTFHQVIEFDSEENVTYFSDLWHGDPPMAPANPGYSRRVAEVKDSIMYRLAVKRKTFLTITDTMTRIEDLWNGILKDDFVYSFRNTLELKAYSAIEKKFHSLIWRMEKMAREFRISKAKIELLKYDQEVELQKAVNMIVSDLTKEMDLLVDQVGKELSSFIETNTLRDVMAQWEQTKLNRMKMLSEDLVFKSKTYIINLKEEIRIKKVRLAEQAKHEAEINELARQLAYEMKGEPPMESVMRAKFENMWLSWLNRFNAKQIDGINLVKDQIDELLLANFSSDLAYINSLRESCDSQVYAEMTRLTGSIKSTDIKDEHISIRHVLQEQISLDKSREMAKYKKQTENLTNKIFRKIDQKLKDINRQDVHFDISYASEILQFIEIDISQHNENTTGQLQFTLPSTFRAMIVNHVIAYITMFFERLNDEYNKKHSPKGQIEAYKERAWNLFKDLVESKTEDMITIGFFKDVLVKAITEEVSSVINLDVEGKGYLLFEHSKYQVMKCIMIDLANKDNFEEYQAFISDPATYAKGFVEDSVYTEVFDKEATDGNVYWISAKIRIDKIFEQLEKRISHAKRTPESIHSADAHVKSIVTVWIENFLKSMEESKTIPLTRDMFVHVLNRPVSDIFSFEQILKDELENIRIETYSNFQNIERTHVKWKVCPITSLMSKLWGCEAKCMFCAEPCKNTDKDHLTFEISHHCIQHRPTGIEGFVNVADNSLAVEFCSALIQSDKKYSFHGEEFRPYKKYKERFPDWDIQPTYDTSKYWMWVMCTYKNELRERYSAKLPDIPNSWYDITKEAAIESLDV